MDDNKKKSSWDDLLQDLGAKPDNSAYERHQPPAQDLPPTAESPTHADATAESSSASSDWNSLAESLGIEVEETAAAESVEKGSVSSARDMDYAADSRVAARQDDAPDASAGLASEGTVAEPFGGNLASDYEAAPEDARADEDRTVVDHEPAGDDLEDAYDEGDEGDEQAAESDDLPALPSQIEQALSDSAWEDDQTEDEQAAADEAAETASGDAESGGISGEAARSAFDALFADGASGWGSAFLDRPKQVDEQGSLVKAVEGDRCDPIESTADSCDGGLPGDEETEKPKRKRSRRRRRGGKGRKSAGDLERGASAGDKQDDEAQAIGGRDELGRAPLDDEGSGSLAKTPRHSRSRRGQQPPAVKDNRLRDDLDAVDEDDFDGDLTGDSLDDSGEGNARGTVRGRKRQSNLPTWSDAIGMIVDGNLEQRAKSPSKPQSSRSRGGRRRGSKKPESK